MTQNERRAIQPDSADAQVQSAGKGEGAYLALREARATRDARFAELATRRLAMHPAVWLDAKVRHGLASLGCVGHPSCVLTTSLRLKLFLRLFQNKSLETIQLRKVKKNKTRPKQPKSVLASPARIPKKFSVHITSALTEFVSRKFQTSPFGSHVRQSKQTPPFGRRNLHYDHPLGAPSSQYVDTKRHRHHQPSLQPFSTVLHPSSCTYLKDPRSGVHYSC
jgi:hypothetical protein